MTSAGRSDLICIRPSDILSVWIVLSLPLSSSPLQPNSLHRSGHFLLKVPFSLPINSCRTSSPVGLKKDGGRSCSTAQFSPPRPIPGLTPKLSASQDFMAEVTHRCPSARGAMVRSYHRATLRTGCESGKSNMVYPKLCQSITSPGRRVRRLRVAQYSHDTSSSGADGGFWTRMQSNGAERRRGRSNHRARNREYISPHRRRAR
mmetsp:Transcript_39245/g.118031  ORF Transcript_39245/g.118031 Transcript_39245/m.118031 type:complete len:204 (+) Transcript_39245:966-1577(+)